MAGGWPWKSWDVGWMQGCVVWPSRWVCKPGVPILPRGEGPGRSVCAASRGHWLGQVCSAVGGGPPPVRPSVVPRRGPRLLLAFCVAPCASPQSWAQTEHGTWIWEGGGGPEGPVRPGVCSPVGLLCSGWYCLLGVGGPVLSRGRGFVETQVQFLKQGACGGCQTGETWCTPTPSRTQPLCPGQWCTEFCPDFTRRQFG